MCAHSEITHAESQNKFSPPTRWTSDLECGESEKIRLMLMEGQINLPSGALLKCILTVHRSTHLRARTVLARACVRLCVVLMLVHIGVFVCVL